MENKDNRCFEWAIFSAKYPAGSDAGRTAKYRMHQRELDFNGISFRVKVSDVAKFEHQNQTLSVNVFEWEKGLYPIYVSKQKGIAIDLLLIVDEANPEKTH